MMLDLTLKVIKNISEAMENTSRGKNKEKRLKIQALVNKAETIAENLKPFTFENFERKMYRTNGDGTKPALRYSENNKRFYF